MLGSLSSGLDGGASDLWGEGRTRFSSTLALLGELPVVLWSVPAAEEPSTWQITDTERAPRPRDWRALIQSRDRW